MEALFGYFKQGGFIMYPLALVSILSMAVTIERFIRLGFSRVFGGALIERVQEALEAGKIGQAIEFSKNSDTIDGKVFSSALTEYANTSVDVETAIQECGQRELVVLWNNLDILKTIYRIAPLMGLLGTVTGMIGAFEVLSNAGAGKEQMAEQIRIALITTAAGLIVAIPTVVADAYFRARIRRILAKFEMIFLDIIKSVRLGEAKVGGKDKLVVIAENPATAVASGSEGKLKSEAETRPESAGKEGK